MPIVTGDDDGIVSPSPTGYAPEPVQTVSVVSSDYRDAAIDSSVTPVDSLVTSIGGYAWTVEYYSQLLNTDSQLVQLSTTVDPAYQQYRKIERFELRVAEPLATRQDPVTKAMVVNGTAIVYTGVIPNVNDAFVADIGVGRPAVFRVTAAEPKSYLKQAAFEIAYVILGTEQEYLDNLALKTVSSYVFKKDQIRFGQSPLVVTSDADLLDQIGMSLDRLINQYLRTFYDTEYATLIIPAQDYPCYDPFLMDFLTKMFRVDEHELVVKLTEINFDDDKVYKQSNFWTAIRERDASELDAGFKHSTLVDASQFKSSAYQYGVRWTGIKFVTYPTDPKIGVAGLKADNVKEPSLGYVMHEDAVVSTFYPRQSNAVDANTAQVPVTPLPIANVLDDDFYVLSEKFYTKDADMDPFEREVWAYLNGDTLDGTQLLNSAKLVWQWGQLEQFYYIPLLIVLLRAHLRSYHVW